MLQKLKYFFAVLLLASFTASPALAESLQQDDMAFAFGKSTMSSASGEVALLSHQEMIETEGELLRHAIRLGGHVWRNTRIDGPSKRGSRIFQVRWRQNPVFRIDYQANPSPTKLHMHFGNMNHHRPWYAPWRTY